ncbi:hypothetical protein KQX54_014663 [Cotesia glomerata]|uniref:Uncharacterized protein n=1 Tax=Cotesia glomerata TaxID=32391 RepID=A0AAV7I039_COTGL|nr:hypothetical protein KQX54_014663 [Cotesia glomerata]
MSIDATSGKEKFIEKNRKEKEKIGEKENEKVNVINGEVRVMEEEIRPINVVAIKLDHTYYLRKEEEEFLMDLNKPQRIETKKNENFRVEKVQNEVKLVLKEKPKLKKEMKKKLPTPKTEKIKLNLSKKKPPVENTWCTARI